MAIGQFFHVALLAKKRIICRLLGHNVGQHATEQVNRVSTENLHLPSTHQLDEEKRHRNLERGRLVLGSGSPRRSSILSGFGIPFVKRPADIDESVRSGERAIDYVCRMAYEKTAKTKDTLCPGEHWVLGADTVVVFDGEILGKPQSEIEAVDMLKKLSGTTHEVITGIGFGHRSGDITVLAERTKVQFRPIQVDEMVRYVGSGKPFDKAGGYGIQDPLADFVLNLTGEYSTVVGLPVYPVGQFLSQNGLIEEGLSMRLGQIRGRVNAACSGDRPPPLLIGASKGQGINLVNEATSLGLTHFGESYVKRCLEKSSNSPILLIGTLSDESKPIS